MKNPGRALQIGAKTGGTLVSNYLKAALLTIPTVINFYQTGKGIHLGKVLQIKI